MNRIETNINFIKNNINNACKKINRNPEEINLIAVTKTIDTEQMNAALKMGIKIIGENKVQEIMEKYDKIEYETQWHMIGHLQTNKVKYIIDKVDLIHSVDSIRLAKEIDKRAKKINKIIDILIQINVADEETKFGLSSNKIDNTIKEISDLGNIRVQGLMAMVPYVEDPEVVRPYFKKMKKIYDSLKNSSFQKVSMNYLSMGMTNDYMVAIEEGSNMIRIGTGIFGERDYNR
ncbi:MAG: YggS family pyridoxal phosphate-dependent enzyme [Clostridia bacterium]|nr:YggS family pyridoxal phosphate-dependent enzyme [Clostridia bacterium]